MAELIYSGGRAFELGKAPVTVGSDPICNLKIEKESDDPEADKLAAAVAAANAAIAAAGAGGAGIIAPSAAAEASKGLMYFAIQYHEPGHFLRDLSGEGAVKVNGKGVVLHRLVDGDRIIVDDEEFEYRNGEMPPGSWEFLEKKRGVRSVRFLPLCILLAALLVFAFYQYVLYGQRKHKEMQQVKFQEKPISNEEARAILEDLSKTKEERLAEMSPEDLRRIREDFLMDENATEAEKEANLAALGKLFGVTTEELLEGGSAEDILAMTEDGGSGRLKYTGPAVSQEEEVLIEDMFTTARETTTVGVTSKREGLARLGAKDLEVVKEVGGNLAALDLGAEGISNMPRSQMAALRLHETEAVRGYMENGDRNSAWDSDVVAALQLDARLRTLVSMPGRRKSQQVLVELVKKAIDAGCRDPHLLLIRERLVKYSSIDIPFKGDRSPIKNAVRIIDGLYVHRSSPLVRARIYGYGIEMAMKEVGTESNRKPMLKGLPFEVWADMPSEVVSEWNQWIDMALEDVVAAAPRLADSSVRDAYVKAVREPLMAFSQARGEHDSILEGIEGLAKIEGGDEALASLALVINR